MFAKRHYKAIAKVLWERRADAETIFAFVRLFERDNSRFDAYRFQRACHGM